jgi:hypothetical protein
VNGGLSTATMTGAVYVSWLFSQALGGGILGGTLLGWKTVCAVERDAYCAAVLAQRQADGCLPIFASLSDITSFDGRPWERPTLERHISADESGFLPTPVTLDTGSRFNRSESNGAQLRPTLGAMARYNLWPTPTVKGNYNRKGLTSKSGDGLATPVARFPTPQL